MFKFAFVTTAVVEIEATLEAKAMTMVNAKLIIFPAIIVNSMAIAVSFAKPNGNYTYLLISKWTTFVEPFLVLINFTFTELAAIIMAYFIITAILISEFEVKTVAA